MPPLKSSVTVRLTDPYPIQIHRDDMVTVYRRGSRPIQIKPRDLEVGDLLEIVAIAGRKPWASRPGHSQAAADEG